MTDDNGVTDTLRDLDADDDVTLVPRGGVELDGTVDGVPHHEPAERLADEPVSVPGRLSLYIHLDAESWSALPSRHVSVNATERKPERWRAPEAAVCRPIYDDADKSVIIGDEYEDLGEIVAVRTGEDR